MPKAQKKTTTKIMTTTLAELLPTLNETLGEQVLSRVGDTPEDLPRLSTGVVALDAALGGGLALGRMAEAYGVEGSGKTALALSTAAQAQRQGGMAVLIDVENAFDPSLAEKVGLNVNDLFVAQPDSAEHVFELVDELVAASDVKCIVVDSVASLIPQAELEGDYGDSHVAVLARLMSQGLRKLNNKIAATHSDVVLIWINQLREKLNVMGYGGPTTTTPGGRALKHYCSTRIELKKIGQVKDGDQVIGHKVQALVAKNRGAPPFRKAVFDAVYDRGWDNEGTILDLAIDCGLVKQSGSWFADTSTGEQLGQGRNKVIDRLINDKELAMLYIAQVLP